MNLADAALVRVAEHERIRRVFTVDRRDFEIYRPLSAGSLRNPALIHRPVCMHLPAKGRSVILTCDIDM